MFGLMRPEKSCSTRTNPKYRHHRMHYCGTCKTLGVEYGQKARTLLNFDTVFFAEILSNLSNDNLTKWEDSLQAINKCLTMPEEATTIPLSLKYAAATNVLLSELKLDDNIKDNGGLGWKFGKQLFSKSFQKANLQLLKWGIDTAVFWELIGAQNQLEKTQKSDFTSLQNLLEFYAKPTAEMTALIFENGAKFVGQNAQSQTMRNLGYQFGQLIYILDAFEDVEKDLKTAQFNPLITFYNPSKTLTEFQFEKVRQIILFLQKEVTKQLKNLSISEEIVQQYSLRLQSNLALRIYKERPVSKDLKIQLKEIQSSVFKFIKQLKSISLTSARAANYYLASLVIYVFPLAANYGTQTSNNWQVYKWMAVFTAGLGAVGLGKSKKGKRAARKAKRQLKKGKRKIQRLYNRFQKVLTGKADCWEDCAAACCAGCIGVCFEAICTEFCNTMCYSIEEGKMWPWLVIGGICVGIAALIVFV